MQANFTLQKEEIVKKKNEEMSKLQHDYDIVKS